MVRGRVLAWLTAGFMSCSALGGVLGVEPAHAQRREPQGSGRDIGPFNTTVRPQTAPRRSTAPSPVAEPGPSPEPGATDPDRQDPTVEDEQQPLRPGTGRRPPVDGDPNWPPQPVQPVDGVIDTQEPQQPLDGDPSVVDTRPKEDFEPFELPANGELPPGDLNPEFNPEALQVELSPILSRRPAQLARFEPFAPAGIRRGSFILFPEAEISVAALDNLFRSSSNVRRDVMLDVRPTMRMASAWNRHALEFRATGLSTFHNRFPSEDTRAYGFEIRGRLDLTRRTNVEAFAGHDLTQEARGSVNPTSRAGDRADIATNRAGVTFNHRFNRLSVQLRGTLTESDYSPTDDGTGLTLDNRERDNTVKEVALRGSWRFKPALSVFSEVAFNQREYAALPGDGISRDSTGERVRFGVSLGDTGRIWRGEASIGHGRQQFEDSRLPEISGIIVDANLAWRLSGITSLLFTARSEVGESSEAGSGGSLSRTAGVELRHEFQRRLIGTAGLRYTHATYEGVDLTEREVAALASLEYYVNREVTLFGRYQHIDFEATERARNYNADELRIGMRIRR